MSLIYQVICDVLEEQGRITAAIECFQQMGINLTEDTDFHAERALWELSEWLHGI